MSNNDLVLIDESQINAIELFAKDNGFDPIIDKIKEQVNSEVFDVSTEDGRKRINSIARKIGGAKTTIDELGKQLTEDWRKQTAVVNKERARVREELDALRDDIKAPLEKFNERKRLREEAFEQRLRAMEGTADFEHFKAPSSDEVAEQLVTLKKLYTVSNDNGVQEWEEFTVRAKQVYEQTKVKLESLLELRKAEEAKEAELQKFRQEQQEREKAEHEERLKREAAEQARMESERKAQAERETLEREKCQAEERARKAEADKQAAVEAERLKLQQEEENRIAEQKRREADVAHKSSIQNAIFEDLVANGVSADDAPLALEAMVTGKIRNVKIIY